MYFIIVLHALYVCEETIKSCKKKENMNFESVTEMHDIHVTIQSAGNSSLFVRTLHYILICQ